MPMASCALIRLGPSDRHDGDREQQGREREQDVHEAHEDVVGPAADVARRCAPMVGADDDREADRRRSRLTSETRAP